MISSKQAYKDGMWIPHALGGLYEITNTIGKGSSSRCFAAVSVGGERVALKIYSRLTHAGKSLLEYTDELEMHATVKDVPGVARLRFGFHLDFNYFSVPARAHALELDLYEKDLETAIWRRELTEASMYRYALDFFGALEGVHALGILHLDLSPKNILLKGGRAYLADFGLAAKKEDFLAAKDITVTSLWFRCPDTYGARTTGETADVWGAGCTLLAMARSVYEAADFPWRADSEEGQLRIIRESGGPATYLPHAPAPLVECLSRMLSLEPSNRQSITPFIPYIEAQLVRAGHAEDQCRSADPVYSEEGGAPPSRGS